MVSLSNTLVNDIKREGETAYPYECCGILFGNVDEMDQKRVLQIEPIRNAREENEQYHRFLITPMDLMKAERKARNLKMDILGFYHSHPDHPAKPSDFDRQHALPFYSYIIVSVNDKIPTDFTSWELAKDRTCFYPENIVIIKP